MSAAEEPITSPDQKKPTKRNWLYTALLVSATIILLFLFGNHTGWIEDVFIVLSAGSLVAFVASDWAMRKRGWR
ncbi:DUF2631 domain-containing protein [Haloglycomyces albus]|uniref:DUF2631 domain-containing protein n=1 Tax=Haloglycomyces albus TaxID=526067 RepID=UPI0004A4B9A6|nr:DUF2631 domain-containing protein [Haloglycomyces albus]